MRRLVNGMADGSLRGGVALWYARQHIARCPVCQAALAALSTLRDRLRALRRADDASAPDDALAPHRRAALDAAWGRVDAARAGKPPP
jgi:hypothetical protein